MKQIRLLKLVLAAAIITFSTSACARPADSNEVAKRMVIMLQSRHYARIPYDEALSRKFLDEYLYQLDGQKLYFTKADVENFEVKYGNRLHALILQDKGMSAATEIYRIFEQRAEARIRFAEKMLANGDFDFSGDEKVMVNRKDAKWPTNEKEAENLWRLQIREAVLSEMLRRETVMQHAKEKGRLRPDGDHGNVYEKITLRYKRLLADIKEMSGEDIADSFLSAVANSYDPHTDYMSSREMNRFKDGMRNELVGIGAQLQSGDDGTVKITGIVVGGPADREGNLKLNDRLIAVDHLNSGRPEDMEDIMFMRIDKVVDLIRGKEGTTVGLKVEPAGAAPGETKIISIQRAKVEMKEEQASGEIIEKKLAGGETRRLGIIALPSFYVDFDGGGVSSSVDVERLLNRLMVERIEGLIFDVRSNGGGSLEEVKRMAGFFIGGTPVVQVRNALGKAQVLTSGYGKPLYSGPLVVLTDKNSASASEILAGVLQDANRAVIVGDSSTFGKGTVQQQMDIGRQLPLFSTRNRAGHLKVTIQKFYRPSGSSTQMGGVVPHIVVPGLYDGLEIGEAFLRNPLPHDRIRPANGLKPLGPADLFLAELRKRNRARINENKDFFYIIEDVMKMRERSKANAMSLNMEVRKAELKEAELVDERRNEERRSRFQSMEKEDKKRMKFFKITLDDLNEDKQLQSFDPSQKKNEYMRRVEDEEESLNDAPEWPSGLDPLKRESLYVLADLVGLREASRMATLLKQDSNTR